MVIIKIASFYDILIAGCAAAVFQCWSSTKQQQ
jgi:hypothetical protein